LTLSKLSHKELLQLARSVSDTLVSDNTSRNALISLIKESASTEEVRKKVKEARGRQITVDMFYRLFLLKISIVMISAGILVIASASFYYSYQSSYLNSIGIYTGEAWYSMREVTTVLNFFGVVLRAIGIMLLVYWLIVSALKISSENRTAASILVLGCAVILFGMLVNFQILIYPYYYPNY
jgi:hypothetical protein